jgi:hypothetical protein
MKEIGLLEDTNHRPRLKKNIKGNSDKNSIFLFDMTQAAQKQKKLWRTQDSKVIS